MNFGSSVDCCRIDTRDRINLIRVSSCVRVYRCGSPIRRTRRPRRCATSTAPASGCRCSCSPTGAFNVHFVCCGCARCVDRDICLFVSPLFVGAVSAAACATCSTPFSSQRNLCCSFECENERSFVFTRYGAYIVDELRKYKQPVTNPTSIVDSHTNRLSCSFIVVVANR